MTGHTPVQFRFDGRVYLAEAGDTIAAALLRAGVRQLRRAPSGGAPRGLFCCMGICQECVVEVDGIHREACRTPVTAGMVVNTPDGDEP